MNSDQAILLVKLENQTPAESGIWSPDGKIFYIGSYDGVFAYQIATQKELFHTEQGSRVLSLAVSPDGNTLALGKADIPSPGLNFVSLIDAKTGEFKTIIGAHRNWVEGIAFSPNGNLLASCGDDGQVQLWTVSEGGASLRQLTQTDKEILGLAFSPDGNSLASGGLDTNINIWETTHFQQTKTLSMQDNYVTDIAFSSDGQNIAASSLDHKVRIWNVATGQILHELEYPGQVLAITFSLDGKIVAGGGVGESIFLWDVDTGVQIGELYLGPSYITSLAYSPDGLVLASVNAGEVWLWNENKP